MLVRSQTLQLSSSTPGAAHHMLMFTPHAPCSLNARSVGRSVNLANLMQDAATYLCLYPYQEETAPQHSTAQGIRTLSHGGSHGSSTSGMAPCRRRDPQMGRVPLLLVLVLVLLKCERAQRHIPASQHQAYQASAQALGHLGPGIGTATTTATRGVLCVESRTVWMGVVVAGGETTIRTARNPSQQQSTIHNPPQRLRFSLPLGGTEVGLDEEPARRTGDEGGAASGRVGRQRRTTVRYVHTPYCVPVPVSAALTSHLCDCEVVTGE
ncbi:hypothetical protein CPAR01_10829 [Colletotrichum paranaense]|uniref:Uncharacterized protein n=1 Tax=Colletotrichum paranaense TaxID=1914294 RepID=A0ABQ9S9V8_9PEZI|nr:uncharacterized protein CPAR01_10829 [Colletotrichum paranaense]KAK1531180.1 hypothetical protein CPAR01_10829 [Colletotrichum paranaense]